MKTVRELQAEAMFSDTELARAADVSLNSLRNLKNGISVRPAIAGKVLKALSDKLGREISLRDVEGIVLK